MANDETGLIDEARDATSNAFRNDPGAGLASAGAVASRLRPKTDRSKRLPANLSTLS
jgi:hypothetical protein